MITQPSTASSCKLRAHVPSSALFLLFRLESSPQSIRTLLLSPATGRRQHRRRTPRLASNLNETLIFSPAAGRRRQRRRRAARQRDVADVAALAVADWVYDGVVKEPAHKGHQTPSGFAYISAEQVPSGSFL